MVGKTSERFIFVDGLRGVAAISVMIFHLSCWAGQKPIHAIAPWFWDFFLNFGARGVQIFFVISGFVIAYSLRNAQASIAFILNFILRRSIRLDPPYWVSMALMVLSTWVASHIFHAQHYEKPTFGWLGAHILYMQNILHMGDLVAVYWSLAIEVQLYLVFVLLLFFSQKLVHDPLKARTVHTVLVCILATVSLPMEFLHLGHPPWFPAYWYLFALGALLSQSLVTGNDFPFFIFVGASAIVACLAHESEPIIGCFTATIIWLASRLKKQQVWLAQRPFQYLGAISYSLYLVHIIVMLPLLDFANRHAGSSQIKLLAAAAAAMAVAFVSAHCLHIFVERPSMRLAAHLKGCREGTSLMSSMPLADQ